MTDLAISAENLSKRFWLHRERRTGLKERVVRGRAPKAQEFWALRDATFSVERGTTFGLIGENGSGKSTTLKVLAGIYRPTEGRVEVNGRVSALLELGAGFHGELTGRENIRLNGAILGLSGRQIDAAMDRIIDFAGIGDFIDSPVKIYSSGMFVRLGFAVAVSLDPEILMVDEVIAVGDEEFQRKCFDHLFELRKRGTTIVLVTHSLGLIRDLCDQAAWLDHGEVRELGAAREVADAYIASVNDREVHAEQGDPGATLSPNGAARLGSGEVRITSLEYLDADDDPTPVLLAGSACTIRMHFEARSLISQAVFGLGFLHESGANVAGPNSGRVGSSPRSLGTAMSTSSSTSCSSSRAATRSAPRSSTVVTRMTTRTGSSTYGSAGPATRSPASRECRVLGSSRSSAHATSTGSSVRRPSMLDSESVANVLHALATGHPDRALNVVATSSEIDEERAVLLAALSDDGVLRAGAPLRGRAALARRPAAPRQRELPSLLLRRRRVEATLGQPTLRILRGESRRQPDRQVGPLLPDLRTPPRAVPRYARARAGDRRLSRRRPGVAAPLPRSGGPARRDRHRTQAVQAVAGQYPVEIGDQEDPAFLRLVAERHGPFDIVIDDGGHRMRQQIVSVETALPAASRRWYVPRRGLPHVLLGGVRGAGIRRADLRRVGQGTDRRPPRVPLLLSSSWNPRGRPLGRPPSLRQRGRPRQGESMATIQRGDRHERIHQPTGRGPPA